MDTFTTTLDETAALLRAGKTLLVAGDEALLRKLPHGKWMGGSIPYFMGSEGGFFSRERLAVTPLPDYARLSSIRSYGKDQLRAITADEPERGFSLIVLPGGSGVHAAFAQQAPELPDIYLKPLLGWIAGVAVADIGKVSPRTFDGQSGESYEERAMVMHVELPAGKAAKVEIINVFTQGEGDTLEFDETGFVIGECRINGERRNLAEYVTARALDTRLPLVADYCGAMVNTSFQRVDVATGKVHFYAPVFAGVPYKLAAPVGDYIEAFGQAMKAHPVKPVFTCNCILNYLYGSLEGRKTGTFTGPITFGEVAYQLLNQTMVYLTVVDV